MANVINTRIQLKYDSFSNWNTKNPTLLSGEIAIAYLGPTHTETTPDNGTHPVLFKVGPGAFNSLPWASGLAADVYAWAKKETPDWADFPKLPLEVIDNGTGKFITDVTYSDNKLTITRDDAVNTLAVDDDNTVILTIDKSKGDVTIKGEHKVAGPAEGFAGGAETGEIDAFGESMTIIVPKLIVDGYGHTTAAEDVEYKITLPTPEAATNTVTTLTAGDGINITDSATDGNHNYTVSHAVPETVAEDVTGEHFKFVSGLTFDEFGHVTDTETHTLDFNL